MRKGNDYTVYDNDTLTPGYRLAMMNGLKMTVHIWICSEIRLTTFQKTL